MELKLHHVNYSTKDVGAVAEFYRSLFGMKPASGYEDARITSQGYPGKVEFLTDGTTEFHISPQDLGVAFRTKQSLNPVDRGHIAFRIPFREWRWADRCRSRFRYRRHKGHWRC